MKTVTLAELAALVGGEVVGDSTLAIKALAPLETVGEGEITFAVKATGPEDLHGIKATAVIVPRSVEEGSLPLLRVDDPNLASVVIQNFLLEEAFCAGGIHPTAHTGEGCQLSQEISIGPKAVLGDRVILGREVVIGPGTVLGDDVVIGDKTVIGANVSIVQGCTVGKRGLIHPGVVIGSDGYGFAADSQGCHIKRPQLGVVTIGDDVEIGANSCIDRATFGITRIHSGVKIDNLVHVAHNVDVGENSLLVAQCGIAGSTTLGRNVIVGGAVAIKDHLHIGDRVMIAPKSGVHNSQPEGVVLCGIPAIPIKPWIKATTVFTRLPEMYRDIKKLKKQLSDLVKKSKE